MVHTKGGVIFDSPCVTGNLLLSGGDNYRYLGILECETILPKEVKEAKRKDYLNKLQEILKASMSANNSITSIRTYTMPVIWYGFGVLHWKQTELWVLNRNT